MFKEGHAPACEDCYMRPKTHYMHWSHRTPCGFSRPNFVAPVVTGDEPLDHVFLPKLRPGETWVDDLEQVDQITCEECKTWVEEELAILKSFCKHLRGARRARVGGWCKVFKVDVDPLEDCEKCWYRRERD